MRAITRETIQTLREISLAEGRSRSTVDRHMANLRAVLRKCATEWGYLKAASHVPMYNTKNGDFKWLTHAQFDALHAELPEHLKLAARLRGSDGTAHAIHAAVDVGQD